MAEPQYSYMYNGVRLKFEPIAEWYQCQICKVCISDKDKFFLHKETKHPPRDYDSDSSLDDGEEEESDEQEVFPQAPEEITVLDLVSSSSSNNSIVLESEDEDEDEEDGDNTPKTKSSPIIKIEPFGISSPVAEKDIQALEQWKSNVFSNNSDATSTSHNSLSTSRQPPPKASGSRTLIESSAPSSTCNKSDRPPKRRNSNNNNNQQREEGVDEGVGTSSSKRLRQEEESPSSSSTPLTSSSSVEETVDDNNEEDPDVEDDGNLAENASAPHTCCICSKKFCFRANLNCHLSMAHLSRKASNGKKLLKCGLCSTTFSTRKQLISHAFTHTGEFRFKCPSCGAGFINKKKFQDHSKACV